MSTGLFSYQKLKDSGLPWVGNIPSHWELPPNGSLLKKRKTLVGEKQHIMTLLSLTKQGVIIRDLTKMKGKFSADMANFQEVHPGDLIFCLFDVPETPRTVGLAKYDGMITGAYTVFEITDSTTAQFIELFYIAMDDRKLLSPLYSGLRNTIPPTTFLRTKLPLPPLSEQQAIVKYLDYMDHRIKKFIRNKKKMIKLLEEQKQAIIHQAVTRGLDPHVKLKPSGVAWLGDIPEGWEVMRLKNISSVQSGLTLGKDYSNVELENYPYLRVANVQTGTLKLNVVKTVKIPIIDAEKVTLQENDVLMTEGGDIDKLGRGCVWKGEIKNCLHQNHIFAVRCKTKMLLPQYLAILTESQIGRDYFQLTANQTTNLASTNITKLKAFPISVPPLDTQIEILNSIDQVVFPLMKSIKKIEQEISLLQEYRTRLISDVVTGKVDIREAAKNLPEELNYQDEDLVEDPDEDAEYDSEEGESVE